MTLRSFEDCTAYNDKMTGGFTITQSYSVVRQTRIYSAESIFRLLEMKLANLNQEYSNTRQMLPAI